MPRMHQIILPTLMTFLCLTKFASAIYHGGMDTRLIRLFQARSTLRIKGCSDKTKMILARERLFDEEASESVDKI